MLIDKVVNKIILSISKIDITYIYTYIYSIHFYIATYDLGMGVGPSCFLHPSKSLILHISIIKYLEIQHEKIKRSTIKVLLLSSQIYTERGMGIVFLLSFRNRTSIFMFSFQIRLLLYIFLAI